MNRRLAIFFTSAITIILAWFYLLYSPVSNSLAQIQTEALKIEEKALRIKQEITTLPDILKAQHEATIEQEQLAIDLFTRNEIMSLLSKINHGCKLNRMTPLEVRPPLEELLELSESSPRAESPQFLNLTLVLKGSYKGFGKFIALLEKAPYFRGVNSSRIIASDDQINPIQYIIDFKVLLGRIGEETG